MTTIVTVCTGNICRSPAAELLLQSYLGDLATVRSAGTHAMVDHGIPAPMLVCLDADTIDGRSHRAVQLTASLSRSADLVITMTALHRRWAVSEAPFALKRTFMLEEIATAARMGAPLAGDTPAERLGNVADAVQDFRPSLAGLVIADVPDPYGGPQHEYDEAYAMIRASVQDIANWVRN
jgi:protein-tyrosine phosphatase